MGIKVFGGVTSMILGVGVLVLVLVLRSKGLLDLGLAWAIVLGVALFMLSQMFPVAVPIAFAVFKIWGKLHLGWGWIALAIGIFVIQTIAQSLAEYEFE